MRESVLCLMWDSIEWILNVAWFVSDPAVVGWAVLFEINCKEAGAVKPRKPFESRMEDDTWAWYKIVFCKLFSIWYWSDLENDRDGRSSYVFT